MSGLYYTWSLGVMVIMSLCRGVGGVGVRPTQETANFPTVPGTARHHHVGRRSSQAQPIVTQYSKQLQLGDTI
jgi:hypothetical protein